MDISLRKPTRRRRRPQQGPAGFADLIAKVKPAVISVRVKVDESATDDDGPNTSGQEMQPFMQGSPFEQFFRHSARTARAASSATACTRTR